MLPQCRKYVFTVTLSTRKARQLPENVKQTKHINDKNVDHTKFYLQCDCQYLSLVDRYICPLYKLLTTSHPNHSYHTQSCCTTGKKSIGAQGVQEYCKYSVNCWCHGWVGMARQLCSGLNYPPNVSSHSVQSCFSHTKCTNTIFAHSTSATQQTTLRTGFYTIIIMTSIIPGKINH